MAYSISWYDNEPIVLLKFHGKVTGRQITTALDEIWSDARFGAISHQIWDCHRITELDVDWPDLQALKLMACENHAAASRRAGKVALVASREVVYACCKAIIAMTRNDGLKKKVVRSVHEARDWLRLETPRSPSENRPVVQ
jgi:hypothetical protein